MSSSLQIEAKVDEVINSAIDSILLNAIRKNMSRPLRIQYPGAWYQVMNCGRRGGGIFKEKKNCLAFIDLLKMFSENRAESRKRYTTFILLETPEEINQILS